LARALVALVVAAACSLLAATPADAAARDIQVVARKSLSARLTELTVSTPALDFRAHVRVLLPSRYHLHQHRRYPVLYLLHGSFDTPSSWTDKGDAERATAGLPLIVVMPQDAGKGNAGGWASDWFNESHRGPPRWETFTIAQLIPWIDAHYRTRHARAGRAIAGLSSGGFEAMSLAARHPDMFLAASSYSGAVDTNFPPVWPVIEGETLADGGRTPDSIWGPRPTEEVRWRAHNPWDLAANFAGMTLAIRTGNGEPGPFDTSPFPDPIEAGVHQMSSSLHQRLTALNIAHVFDDYGPGTHSWPYWHRDLVTDLPRLMAAFSHPRAAPSPFTYRAAEASFSVYGWRVRMHRTAMEFAQLAGASRAGFALRGSGTADVWTPGLYPGRSSCRVTVRGARSRPRVGRNGRLHLRVFLGPPNSQQQYRAGTITRVFESTVRIVRCTKRRRPQPTL
jgi:S-formylglutathione hydrolase FrmB